jgi:hypothetical protein
MTLYTSYLLIFVINLTWIVFRIRYFIFEFFWNLLSFPYRFLTTKVIELDRWLTDFVIKRELLEWGPKQLIYCCFSWEAEQHSVFYITFLVFIYMPMFFLLYYCFFVILISITFVAITLPWSIMVYRPRIAYEPCPYFALDEGSSWAWSPEACWWLAYDSIYYITGPVVILFLWHYASVVIYKPWKVAVHGLYTVRVREYRLKIIREGKNISENHDLIEAIMSDSYVQHDIMLYKEFLIDKKLMDVVRELHGKKWVVVEEIQDYTADCTVTYRYVNPIGHWIYIIVDEVYPVPSFKVKKKWAVFWYI